MARVHAPKNLNERSKSKNRVIPLQSHQLGEMVTTIGFSAPGLTAAESLLKKNTYEGLKVRLGGKGAGLVSMVKLGAPVPPAFNLSTALCALYLARQNLPKAVVDNCHTAIAGMEKA
ncbi:MAG: pyruvate phosphate dikinase, partial [Bacteriovoracaceae bacterium]|nr:pyruvate phosphate dikinase [Bacteriovoracaceae bacterium]